MLTEKFRYIALDFETTGLDREKDEPIQVGIVEFDYKWDIVSEFSSLIKPKKDILELKDIVGFITWLSLSDLEKSPKIEDIRDNILSYFDERTVIIGHNIDFDISFLKRYFPDINVEKTIDTYLWALNFVHFAPSYALEVLVEYLAEKDDYMQNLMQKIKVKDSELMDEVSYHDALFDSKISWILFFYFVGLVENLLEKYTDLCYMLQQQDSFLMELFNMELKRDKYHFSVPVLEKYVSQGASLSKELDSIDLKKLEKYERYYIWNISFRKILRRLIGNKKILLAFSHKQKFDMAKHILQDLGVKNIWYVNGDQVLNYSVFSAFLNKWNFSEDELFFMLKYFSHHYKWFWFLDLNSTRDYKIYALLKEEKKLLSYPVVLATHGGLYNLIQNHQKFRDYKIVFFDQEWWYRNFNIFLSRSCDLYYILQNLEKLQYVYDVRNQIKTGKYEKTMTVLTEFINKFQMFMGVLFLETKRLFPNGAVNRVQSNPILDNTDFPKANIVWKELLEKKNELQMFLLEVDSEFVEKNISHIAENLDTVVNINKKDFRSWEMNFVYQEALKFTQWNEFLEFFGEQDVSFFSNTSSQYLSLDSEDSISIWFEIKKISNIGKVINYVEELLEKKWQESISCFILSSLKNQSRELFEIFYQKNIHKEILLLAENITGGIGKSVFKAKHSEQKIMIGSYNFYMWLISKWITIDNLIVFNIKWKTEDLMFNDVLWYWE